MKHLIEEAAGFYRVIELAAFRRTAGVSFDILPKQFIPQVDAVDRVIHGTKAVSPGPVAGVERPWYMHPHQDDHLMVLQGTRLVDIYQIKAGRMLSFEVTPDEIRRDGKVIHHGPTLLVWPRTVFHRIVSGDTGSASVNFATRHKGFDILKNFTIYDLDVKTGRFKTIREGHLDQLPESY